MPEFTYTTGSTSLPDVGVLSYTANNTTCTFSPLFTTQVSGKIVPDDARRTTKLMEYKLTVEGYVTLTNTSTSISPSTNVMRQVLQAHGGVLNYTGRGFDLTKINQEVMWGPVPELIEFQPLGGGLSAKVKWEVTFRTPDTARGTHLPRGGNDAAKSPLLQFNYETNVTYAKDYYSSMTIKGTMEIPLSRTSNVQPGGRRLTTTVDSVRTELDRNIFSGIDLSRFYVVRRDYHVSRDKRTMNFDIAVEEKPYMDLPPNCTTARGSYNVRPAKAGPGLVLWLCTLRATYTIRGDAPRRWAWNAFLALLQLRMGSAVFGNIDGVDGVNQARQNPPQPQIQGPTLGNTLRGILLPSGLAAALSTWNNATLDNIEMRNRNNLGNPIGIRAWLIDFSFDEGLYEDSKQVTFSATWRLITTFSHILLASGIWRKLPEKDQAGNNLWAQSMADVSGALSWMPNYLDPSKDIIIDFGY